MIEYIIISGNMQTSMSITTKCFFTGEVNANFEEYKDGINIHSCTHYKTDCNILAPCCKKWFPCRVCHDAVCDHEIDRYKIKTIKCKKCNTVQSKSNKCTNCSIKFSEYHCDKCNLWSSLQDGNIYHCDDCNVCRKGNGIGIDRYHCKGCNMCIELNSKERHICFKNSACPICLEEILNSRDEGLALRKCGHVIHTKCLQEYIDKGHRKCPLCKKSLWDDNKTWDKIDKILENEIIPEPYNKWRTHITCNDCEKRSITRYHFQFHKCNHCCSYNTDIVKIIKEDKSQEDSVINLIMGD